MITNIVIEKRKVAMIAPLLWPKDTSTIREFRLIIAVLRRFFDSNFRILTLTFLVCLLFFDFSEQNYTFHSKETNTFLSLLLFSFLFVDIPLKQQETTTIDEWVEIVAKQMHKFLPFDIAVDYLKKMFYDILSIFFYSLFMNFL